MNRKLIARELCILAKSILAEDSDYVYDPDHKHKPKGGHWEKTEKGWSQKKEEKKDKSKEKSKIDSKTISNPNYKRLPKEWQFENDLLSNSVCFDEGLFDFNDFLYGEFGEYYDEEDDVFDITLDEFLESQASEKQKETIGIKQRVGLASKTKDPGTLAVLSNHTDREIKKAVAKNLNTPSDVLEKMSKDKSFIVKAIVAENPNTPPETLDRLSEEELEYTRVSVAKNPNTLPETLTKLSDDKDNFVKRGAICNPNCPSEVLIKMSGDKGGDVRSCVAQNPNTPIDILTNLSKDNDIHVRKHVASNHNTPVEVIRELCNDKEEDVREYAKVQLKKRQSLDNANIDLSKLSPELREQVKDMDPEELKKFIGWLKERKG